MADSERAKQAARARAKLKRRQQQKNAEGTNPDETASTAGNGDDQSSRALSPAPLDPDKLFPKDGSDTSWINDLPRAPEPRNGTPTLSPPPDSTASITAPISEKDPRVQGALISLQSENATLKDEINYLRDLESMAKHSETLLETERNRSKQLENQLQHLQAAAEESSQNQQQTISLLVTEKTSLADELQRLGDMEATAHATENELHSEQQNSKQLLMDLGKLRSEIESASQEVKLLRGKEKLLQDQYREQERELQLTNGAFANLKTESEQFQRRIRELEEEIQGDDRLERMEVSLKNTQDRADELEFQLSKLQQAHVNLKTEKDAIDAQHNSYLAKESEWTSSISELRDTCALLQANLDSATSDKENLAQENTALKSELNAARPTILEIQASLAKSLAELETNARQLHTAQVELKQAQWRAEEAERIQADLQAEGTQLMESLNEMRPKIVELTGVKLDLGDKIERMEQDIHRRDEAISKLENELGEVHAELDNVLNHQKEEDALTQKALVLAQSNSTEVQKENKALQDELDSSLASLRNLEGERLTFRQEATSRQEEIDRLSSSAHEMRDEISALRQELDKRRKEQGEERDFLERTQNEIEALRSELKEKDMVIEEFREASASSTPIRANAPHSLDNEMINSIRQQHALELSSAHSTIRAMENSVFDAEAQSHALRKEVTSLENQLVRLRAAPQRPFSPGVPSRPSSRNMSHDIHRPPLGPHKSSGLARSVFDTSMTTETQHKRIVSLSMLKARIDSEVAATSPFTSSRALTPVQDHTEILHQSNPPQPVHRPQFLDESHVFWCSSCYGDLVIL